MVLTLERADARLADQGRAAVSAALFGNYGRCRVVFREATLGAP
jgi:hypothetical protein